jgi:hypothetical protein
MKTAGDREYVTLGVKPASEAGLEKIPVLSNLAEATLTPEDVEMDAEHPRGAETHLNTNLVSKWTRK